MTSSSMASSPLAVINTSKPACAAPADGGHHLLDRQLLLPARREVPVDDAGERFGEGLAGDPLSTLVDQRGRRSLEEGEERPPGRLPEAGLVQGARHGGQPCVALGRADREAAMSLAQAERPARARVL